MSASHPDPLTLERFGRAAIMEAFGEMPTGLEAAYSRVVDHVLTNHVAPTDLRSHHKPSPLDAIFGGGPTMLVPDGALPVDAIGGATPGLAPRPDDAGMLFDLDPAPTSSPHISASMPALLTLAREQFHTRLRNTLLTLDARGLPTNADRSDTGSRPVAVALAAALHAVPSRERHTASGLASAFDSAVCDYLAATFPTLSVLRPGVWSIDPGAALADTMPAHTEAVPLVRPSLVITRQPATTAFINTGRALLDVDAPTSSPLHARSDAPTPLLHAAAWCAWTLPLERSHSIRLQALDLLRYRNGRAPHVVVVTADPVPARLAAVALGTGDVDCVYHVALPELADAVAAHGRDADRTHLDSLLAAGRLRDISDLPLDLCV